MTKIYLLAVFCFLSLTTIAQIKKNSILLGGDFSYSRNNNQVFNYESKNSNGFLGISIGKAFRQNSVIGISVSAAPTLHSNYIYGNDTFQIKNNNYNAGLFYREYKQLGKDFYFFGNANASYHISNEKADHQSANKDTERKRKGATIGISPGLSYQLFKKLQVELTIPSLISISYFTSKYEDQQFPGTVSKEKSFSISSNLFGNSTLGNLGLGFRFLL
jgi:hypothetical protein